MKKEKRSHLISNLVLSTLSQIILQMNRRQNATSQRILSELCQFLEVPPFLLDICSLSSQGLVLLFRKQCGSLCPGLRCKGRGRARAGFRHLALPLREVSLAQGLELSESLNDP